MLGATRGGGGGGGSGGQVKPQPGKPGGALMKAEFQELPIIAAKAVSSLSLTWIFQQEICGGACSGGLGGGIPVLCTGEDRPKEKRPKEKVLAK